MILLAVFICFDAIIAEPITARAWPALILWDVSTRSARAIVVMNATFERLFYLIDGVEGRYCGHGIFPPEQELYAQS